jgi:hypothetical protein
MHPIAHHANGAHCCLVGVGTQCALLFPLELLQQLPALAVQVEEAQHSSGTHPNFSDFNTFSDRSRDNYAFNTPVFPALLARLPPGEAKAAADHCQEPHQHRVEPAMAPSVEFCRGQHKGTVMLLPPKSLGTQRRGGFGLAGHLVPPGQVRCPPQPAPLPRHTRLHAVVAACATEWPPPCRWVIG